MQEYNSQPGRSRDTMPLPAQPPVEFIPAARPAPKRQSRVRGTLVAAALGLGLVAGGVGGGATAWTLSQANASHTVVATAPAASNAQPVVNANANTIGSLYTKVAQSIVQVQTTLGSGRFSGAGEGSGIVIDGSHILTNYHVVQGANTITVVLQDGTQVKATVAGTAPQDDLAVLSATLPADKVAVATLGDSDSVQVGDDVVAIGNPFGLADTVTAGIVSAVNRNWSEGNAPAEPFIQTDAPINPGNSGGALFNMQGQVIGVTTAIQSPVDGSVGIGFAIPINRAKSLLPQLTQGSTVQRVWLGISGMALDASTAQQINAPVTSGVLVVGVTSGSPAEAAGLIGADPSTSNSLGDIITAIDGHTVSQPTDISNYLANKKAGDTVTLTIIRNGQQQQVKVTVQPWPASDQQQQNSGSGQSPFGGSNGSGQSPFPFGGGSNGSGNGNTLP